MVDGTPPVSSRLASSMASALLTVCFLAGIAAVSYGSWLAWRPGGFIAGGLFLIMVPLWYEKGGS